MSEGAGAEATSSETSGSVAAATAAATAAPAAASAADPLAAVAIDELLVANDDHESSTKRKYPEPGFRSRKVRASRRERELHHRVQTEGSNIHETWARCGSTHSWMCIVEIAHGAVSPMGVRKYN